MIGRSRNTICTCWPEQIVDGRRRTAIGHVHDVDLRRQLEQFAGQMRQAAGAGRCEIEFSGLRLGQRDQFAHVLGGNIARDHQHFRHLRDQGDGLQILQRIVGDLFHAGADGERARARNRDGVAVRFRLRHRVGSEHAALSAAVVDQHRLLGQFRHALADHARDDVVGAAGRKRHDQPDRPGRENPAPQPMPAQQQDNPVQRRISCRLHANLSVRSALARSMNLLDPSRRRRRGPRRGG